MTDDKNASNVKKEMFLKRFDELLGIYYGKRWLKIHFETEIFGNASGEPYEYRLFMEIRPNDQLGIYRYGEMTYYIGFYKENGQHEAEILPNELTNKFISMIEDIGSVSIQTITYDTIEYQ